MANTFNSMGENTDFSSVVFSDKVKDMKPSAIREIFKSLSVPGMISFAAGNPSPASFPIDALKEISNDIFNECPAVALQYGITEGYAPLRKQVAERLASKFASCGDDDEVVITTGGQQGIDLTAKALCNEHDVVITENPSFIGALNAFRAYNTHIVGVDTDEDGMIPEKLEEALKTNKNVKLIYTIPTFQNPTGVTQTLQRRKAVLALAEKYGVVILEDNPYGELRFAGDDVPTIKSLDKHGIVVYSGSFSKILSSGMRIGFLCGRKDIIQKVVVLKQVNDVHTNLFFQMVASRYIDKYDLDAHIAGIRKLYRQKCNLMISCMENEFPEYAKFTRPQGGLFLWVTLPSQYDADSFTKTGMENKVAVVSGSAFAPVQGAKTSSFRLNYSMPSDEEIQTGIGRLADIIKKLNPMG